MNNKTLKKISFYKPYMCKKSIFDIDYKQLYIEGYRTIFFDVDNTIGSLSTPFPSLEVKELIDSIKKIGLNPIIWSNSPYNRVRNYGEYLGINFIHRAFKPLTKRILKYADQNKIDLSCAIGVGDQLSTDVLLSSRLAIPCILVSPINPDDEKWYTKINRRRANRKIVSKFKDIDINLYNEIRSISNGEN